MARLMIPGAADNFVASAEQMSDVAVDVIPGIFSAGLADLISFGGIPRGDRCAGYGICCIQDGNGNEVSLRSYRYQSLSAAIQSGRTGLNTAVAANPFGCWRVRSHARSA